MHLRDRRRIFLGVMFCVVSAFASSGVTRPPPWLVDFEAAAAADGVAGQTQDPLMVAYMTYGGELVPIARFDGTAWRNTWPAPIDRDAPLPVRTVSDIPRAWLGQPVPLTWTVWSQATRQQQRVTVTGVDREGSCVEAITLATSFHPNPQSDGLAFNRPTRVDAIVALEQRSRDLLRRDVASHFRTALASIVHSQPGSEHSRIGAKVLLALTRADTLTDDTVIIEAVLSDSRFPVMFIEAQREFGGIPADTDDDALSYSGWFRRDRSGALVPISASVTSFSTAAGKSPSYTPIGIVRLGVGSIWAMSEIHGELQDIVLVDISDQGVRKLISAHIDGC